MAERAEFTVGAAEAGARLDVVLAARAGLSRAAAQRLLAGGEVTVDGRPARKRDVVRAGQVVRYPVPEAGPSPLAPEPVPFTVVYEDPWLLVVDKPAGVVVHPAPGHEHGTLVHGLLALGVAGGHERRPGIVHRLDRDTSGLLLVARRDDAYASLVAALARRDVHRSYLALLHGELPQDAGTVDAPIGRHPRDRSRMSLLAPDARRAVTHFRVVARGGGHTLVRVSLETGRTHQIRVHFAGLGYPVVGDLTYGRRPRPAGLARHLLHACRLTFPHPADGREVTCVSPLPPEFAAVVAGLGLPVPQP